MHRFFLVIANGKWPVSIAKSSNLANTIVENEYHLKGSKENGSY